MNYYIQGDAAKADKIKAAFEDKGIYSTCNFENENYLYYSCDGKVAFCFIGGGLANIIKTHPDYQELELHVQPKFKVGDEIIWNEPKGSKPTEPVKIIQLIDKDQLYMVDMQNGVGYVAYDMQDYYKLVQKPHYDIANFNPFDKVLVRCSNDEEWMIEFYCKYDTLVHTSPHRDYPFMGIGDSYSQCIPFEGNEHLLGSTDMPDEMYINW